MPRLSRNEREQAIGRLRAGQCAQIVANAHKVNIGTIYRLGARCSSVVRAFAHGAIGRRIDTSWGGPIELFLVPASSPRPWYVLSCLLNSSMGAYKRTLAVYRNE